MFSSPSRRTAGALCGALVALAVVMPAGCASYRCESVASFGNLGPQINSESDDYAPALPDTATLVFTSNRVIPGHGGIREHARKVRPTYLLTSMRLTASWDDAQLYPLLLGQPETESATIAFAPAGSPFGTTAYVSLCGGERSVGGCDLYAVTTGGRGALVNLGPMVNSSGWDGQPSISADGRRLFFASDRAGGFGGTDIWYTARSSNNVWDAPVNAGPHVNTDGDELSPHVLPSGRLLFTGAVPGRGREIIAYNPNSDTSVVLDSPFNSESDELTPFVVNGVLYLASDRAGGCGGYDLYAFPALDLNR